MSSHLRLVSRYLPRTGISSTQTIPHFKSPPPTKTPITQLPTSPHVNSLVRQITTTGSVFEKQGSSKEGTRRSRLLKLVGGGLLVGAGYGLYSYNKKPADKSGKTVPVDYLLKEPPPEFPPAREIRNPADNTGIKITLFQYQTCPFCCKARSFLDYFGLSYNVVEVNSVMRTQVKWSEYKKVPIVVIQVGDKTLQLNDSTLIVSALYSILASRDDPLEVLKCYPSYKFTDEKDGKEKLEISNKYFLMSGQEERSKEDLAEERKWRKWVDDVLVHMLSPNVYRTPSESLQAFHWFNEVGDWEKHFSWWERNLVIYFGAFVMWILGKRLKKRHHLKEDVRLSLYEECDVWAKAVRKKKTKFLGGDSPNLADLNVFGVLLAIEGCEAFQDVRKNSKISTWFDDMKEVVEKREGQKFLFK